MQMMYLDGKREGSTGGLFGDVLPASKRVGGGILEKFNASPSADTVLTIMEWLKEDGEPDRDTGSFQYASVPVDLEFGGLPTPVPKAWGTGGRVRLATDVVVEAEASAQSLFHSMCHFFEFELKAEVSAVDEGAMTLKATVLQDLESVDVSMSVFPCGDGSLAEKAEAVFAHPSRADVVRFQGVVRRVRASLQADAGCQSGLVELLPFDLDDFDDELVGA